MAIQLTARKCAILAAVVAAFSHTATAAEVYKDADTTFDLFGEVRTRWDESESASHTANGSGSKIGVSGEHRLGELTFKGFTKFEYNGNTHAANTFQVNESYVGLAHTQYGELNIGRKSTIHDTLFGYDSSWAFGGTAKNGHDPFGTGTADSLVQYTWSANGLTLMGQVQGRSEFVNDGYETRVDLDPVDPQSASVRSGVGAGLAWQSDFGLGVKAAYTRANLDSLTETLEGVSPAVILENVTVDSLGAEVDYDIGRFSLAAAAFHFDYSLPGFDEKQTGFGGRASYTVAEPVHLYTVVDYLKSSFSPAAGGTVDMTDSSVTTYTSGVDYWPHKQVMSFVEFSHQVDKADGSAKEENLSMAVGARYYF